MLQGRRSLLLSVVGAASVSAGAGAGYFYRSEGDPNAKLLADREAAGKKQNASQVELGNNETGDHSEQPRSNKRRLTPRKRRIQSSRLDAPAANELEVGLEQSMARKMACWISRASVYASAQLFYASASSHLRSQPTNTDFVSDSGNVGGYGGVEFRAPSASDIDHFSRNGRGGLMPNNSGSDNRGAPRSRRDLYHEMFGWLSDLVETSDSGHGGYVSDSLSTSDWNVAKILHSSSFDFLLNLIAGIDQEAENLQQISGPQQQDDPFHYHKTVLSREIKSQAYRVLNGLSQNPLCAKAIAERSTRYGKRTLLNVSRHHQQDPRVGQALQRLVEEDASDSWYGPANLMSLIALAVAQDIPDEYLEFALWALRKTCSSGGYSTLGDDEARSATSKIVTRGGQPPQKLRRAYQIRKTLFGEDVFAKNRVKLCHNAKLWHALVEMSDRSEQVQFQAAKLLAEMTREASFVDQLTLSATDKEDDPESGDELIGMLMDWLQNSKHVPTVCASLDIIANLCGPRRAEQSTASKFRQRLVDLGFLQMVRQRILKRTSVNANGTDLSPMEACNLNAKLLAVVHRLVSPPTDGDKSGDDESSSPFGVFGFPLDDGALTFVRDPSGNNALLPFGFGFQLDDLVDLCDIQDEDPQIIDGWIDLLTSFLRPQRTNSQEEDNQEQQQTQDLLVAESYDAVCREAVLCLASLARHSAYNHEATQEWLIAILDSVLEQVPATIANNSTIVREAKTRTRPIALDSSTSGGNNALATGTTSAVTIGTPLASALEYEACHARAIRALAFVGSRPDCQNEFARCGGVELLKVLLRSKNPQVQVETARLMANLLACDQMNEEMNAFLTENALAVEKMQEWAEFKVSQPLLSSSTTMKRSLKLASYAQRALANLKYQQQLRETKDNTLSITLSKNLVRYMDDVNILNSLNRAEEMEEEGNDKANVHEAPKGNSPKRSRTNEDEYDVDVVFIHGLMGCPFSTWMHKSDGTLDEDRIWPSEWLERDLQQEYGLKARILSVGYDSKLLGSESTWRKMCLRETGSEILEKLEAAQVGKSQHTQGGTRPVVFVTHSLGGVLLKQILLESSLQKDSDNGTATTQAMNGGESSYSSPWTVPATTRTAASTASNNLVDRVNGVVFYSVPHHGSPIASFVNSLQIGKAFGQHPITEHLHGSPYLKMLNDWCHHAFASRDIEAVSLIEQVPCRLPLIGLEALVVPPELGNPGFGKVQFLNDNHIDVCKPASKEDVRYVITKEMIAKSFLSHQHKQEQTSPRHQTNQERTNPPEQPVDVEEDDKESHQVA